MLPKKQPKTPQIKKSQALDPVYGYKGHGKSEAVYCVVNIYDSAQQLLHAKNPPSPKFEEVETIGKDGEPKTIKKELPGPQAPKPSQVRFKIPAYIEVQPDPDANGEGTASIPSTWMEMNPDFIRSSNPEEFIKDHLENHARKVFGK
jgi:hypothetical protein